ncbi:hypothetical protein [Desulfovirgula thermocuniculi]|uniref:hypothetical protein n=1 Tax=Desulfovirgula thermocuniculi TaxID=348842 RepID=UPI00041CDF5C|nr:hypothetical protein [Desulfovirgula thermocuniculi]
MELDLDQVISFCDSTGYMLLYPEEIEELARVREELEELCRRGDVQPYEFKAVVARAAEVLGKLV